MHPPQMYAGVIGSGAVEASAVEAFFSDWPGRFFFFFFFFFVVISKSTLLGVRRS